MPSTIPDEGSEYQNESDEDLAMSPIPMEGTQTGDY